MTLGTCQYIVKSIYVRNFLLSNKYGLNLNFEKVIEKIKEEVGYIGPEE